MGGVNALQTSGHFQGGGVISCTRHTTWVLCVTLLFVCGPHFSRRPQETRERLPAEVTVFQPHSSSLAVIIILSLSLFLSLSLSVCLCTSTSFYLSLNSSTPSSDLKSHSSCSRHIMDGPHNPPQNQTNAHLLLQLPITPEVQPQPDSAKLPFWHRGTACRSPTRINTLSLAHTHTQRHVAGQERAGDQNK